jgi:dihydrofolate reductase
VSRGRLAGTSLARERGSTWGAEPVVAKGMNEAEKVVFSRTVEKVDWSKTTLVRGDVPDAVRTLKKQSGKNLVVLDSGSVVA